MFNHSNALAFIEIGDEVSTNAVLMAQVADVSYSTRHVEESWHHLMKSEDTAKFKQIAVCNFDFLLAAVSDLFPHMNSSHKLVVYLFLSILFASINPTPYRIQ